MRHGLAPWCVRLGLGAMVAALFAFASGGDRASASAPNPCEIVTEEEAEGVLGFPLAEEPLFGELFGIQACTWTAVADEFGHSAGMGLQLFSGPEDEADLLYDGTIAPYEEEIEGLGDRAKWVSQVIWINRMWGELRIRMGQYYISIYVDKYEPKVMISPTEAQDEMLQVAQIVLSRLEPRAPVEFTQAIQELQENYELSAYLVANGGPPAPIVAGKPTVARVYFDEADEAAVRIVELSDVASAQDTVTVMPGCTVEMQRLRQGGCESADLFFTPPAGEWMAVITIKDGEGNQIDKMEFPIASVDTPAFGVTYLPVCVALTAGAVPTCPSLYVEHDVSELMSKIFPVATGEFFYSRMPLPAINLDAPLANDPQENQLLADLRLRWELLSIGDSPSAFSGDQLAGWLPDGGASTGTLGISDPVWVGSTGRVSWQLDTSATTPLDAEFTLAHEVGHNLGLRHTNQSDACNAQDSTTDWPYMDSTIQEVGFDVSEMQIKEETKFSVMSYCSPPGSNIWISPFTYKKLAEGGFQPQRSGAIPSGDPGQFLLVKGLVKADGSAGSIDSAFVIDSTIPSAPSNPLGEHCLHLTGGAQMDYCFNLTFVEHRSNAPLDEEHFVVRVPLPPGTDEAFLMHNGTELDKLELSASAPEVEIMSPQPGAEWSGEQTIEWTASDPDGGPLSVAVLYSPDGGANWLPMEVTSGDGDYTFDTREIAGDEIMVRVLASDGLNTTDDTVESIVVSNGDPRIWGDNDCDGDSDAVDGLKALQELAGLPYTQNEPCPDLGETVEVTPAGATSERLWGDVDCDGDVDAADGLSILRQAAALPVNQQQPCPAIGSDVLVG